MSLSADWTDVEINWSAKVETGSKNLPSPESEDGKELELCSRGLRVTEAVGCRLLLVSVHVSHLLVVNSGMHKGKVGN